MECLQHAFRALLPILILILITICIPWETLIEGLEEWRGQGEGNGVETHYNRVIDRETQFLIVGIVAIFLIFLVQYNF